MAFNLGGKYPQRERDVSVGSVNIVYAGERPDWLPSTTEAIDIMPSPPEPDMIEAEKLPFGAKKSWRQ